MSLPDYQWLMLPLLEALADGREHDVRDLRDRIAQRLGVTDSDREELLRSGEQPVCRGHRPPGSRNRSR
jgi:restriction system protein